MKEGRIKEDNILECMRECDWCVFACVYSSREAILIEVQSAIECKICAQFVCIGGMLFSHMQYMPLMVIVILSWHFLL